jgi:putative toxin-antitoxin system antitoxin component (TIGR02293 family)
MTKLTHAATLPLDDDIRMAGLVAKGIPADSIRRIAVLLGFSSALRLAPLIGIGAKTIERRLKGGTRLKPDESERVARILRLISRAVEVFQSESAARRWLERPLSVFGGLTPLKMGSSEPGARAVEQVLGKIEHGVFS